MTDRTALSTMLDAVVITDEAKFMSITDDQFAKIDNMTDAEIQDWIEKVNPDFDFEMNKTGRFEDLLADQVTQGAEQVVNAILAGKD